MNSSEHTADFLLAEFSHIRDMWKHIDNRTESAVRQYFTVVTILLSVIAFTYGEITEVTRVEVVVLAFLAGSASFSFLVLRRILQTVLRKIEYLNSMNSIRSYFVSLDPEVRPYVVLPIRDLSESILEVKLKYNNKKKSFSILLFTSWVSIQCAVLIILIIRLWNLKLLVGITLLIGFISFFVFFALVSIHNRNLTNIEIDKVDNNFPKKLE